MRKLIISMISLIIVIILGLSFDAISKENTIVIGTKDYPEQILLGEMLSLLIEEYTDLEVEKKFGYEIEEIHEPLMKGEIDLYPEYTGTGWGATLKKPLIYNKDILYQEVKKAYAKEFDVEWLDRYGYNNAFGLVMKNDKAKEQGIYSYSDLALKSRPLIIGGESSFFNRVDAYPGLEEKYGFEFKNKMILDINAKYDVIDIGEVDVIDVGTTDGLLRKYDLILLYDDQEYFTPYEPATIIRKDTLEEHPELEEVLNKLGGQITDEEMSRLNYLVTNSDLDVNEIAKLFLQSKGLL
ncbi:glycine betaine ABC transporter substrate-binding protein [Vallitalea okinawensis]|uniref:glycine betaine ABC transporter substrate-binding protein n=1 Tax=Vallitalea okinawensis TaxID=2078660 RepID=UPI000CFBF996|nr:glycine betaine ABC transporter substrate-binding protein [Vallitalea okinawensis]